MVCVYDHVAFSTEIDNPIYPMKNSGKGNDILYKGFNIHVCSCGPQLKVYKFLLYFFDFCTTVNYSVQILSNL